MSERNERAPHGQRWKSETGKQWSKPPIEIARDIFSDVPRTQEGDDFLGYVLWNYTGWPAFWHGDPETCLREQLQAYHDDPEGVEAAQEAELDAMLEDYHREQASDRLAQLDYDWHELNDAS